LSSSGLVLSTSKIILSGNTSVRSAAFFSTSLLRWGEAPKSPARSSHISSGHAMSTAAIMRGLTHPARDSDGTDCSGCFLVVLFVQVVLGLEVEMFRGLGLARFGFGLFDSRIQEFKDSHDPRFQIKSLWIYGVRIAYLQQRGCNRGFGLFRLFWV